ncbi:hypothetical protein ASD15_11460 [Massilia sp. Root351]|jgi:hypothetical protein|uniref:hypothetical protein n=1 Tax=Massilia sp. Root351 TaxID=1736522 RepID=UPI0007109E0D|nr:hypothetical protein [Massilia sp. Root351]KQV82599.1 hypothetical protein ASD15_11460 [Massilia sp. Root351]
MTTTTLTAQHALELARSFRETSTALGDYLYAPANWPSLPEGERDTLRSLEVTLLNVATDLVTQAVGKVLDEAQQSVDDLLAVTRQARDAIKRIDDVKAGIAIATALIGLAAAISAGSAGAIFGAFKLVKDTMGTKPAKTGKENAEVKKKAAEPAAVKVKKIKK